MGVSHGHRVDHGEAKWGLASADEGSSMGANQSLGVEAILPMGRRQNCGLPVALPWMGRDGGEEEALASFSWKLSPTQCRGIPPSSSSMRMPTYPRNRVAQDAAK